MRVRAEPAGPVPRSRSPGSSSPRVPVSRRPAAAAVERARLANGDRAALVDKRDLFLETVPKPGEGLITFSRRVTGSPKHTAAVGKANGNPRRLLAGVRYRVPFGLIPPERQLAVIRALYPSDKGGAEGWVHRTRGESSGDGRRVVHRRSRTRWPALREHEQAGQGKARGTDDAPDSERAPAGALPRCGGCCRTGSKPTAAPAPRAPHPRCRRPAGFLSAPP